MATESLTFTVRIAREGRELREACAVRAQAYGHHVPALHDALLEPDAQDLDAGTVVLVCRDKAGGHVVGTARIQRNHPTPLAIEGSITLPPHIAGRTRAEITRLAILPGADPLVRPMLVKACWLYAVAAQIRWLVIGARSSALVRIYRALGFEALSEAPVPLAHAGGLPHHVLAFDIVAAERTWHGQNHGQYAFMVDTWHPDLRLLAEDEPPAFSPAATWAATAVPAPAARA